MEWIKSTPGSTEDGPGLLAHPFPLSSVGQILYTIALFFVSDGHLVLACDGPLVLASPK